MDIFDGVYNYISGSATLLTLLGNPLKLYPEIAPQTAARPYIIFTNHSTNREVHLNGASAIADFYVQFDVYADNVSDRFLVSDALRNYLHTRQNAVLQDNTANRAVLEWAEIQSDMQIMKPLMDGSEVAMFCREMVFRLVIDEPKPTLP